MDDELTLDANAAAGDLQAIFGLDMTPAAHRCAHCGHRGAMATLLAYTHGPGLVLRCSVCREVVVRVVVTPQGTRLDLRGAAFIGLPG